MLPQTRFQLGFGVELWCSENQTEKKTQDKIGDKVDIGGLGFRGIRGYVV